VPLTAHQPATTPNPPLAGSGLAPLLGDAVTVGALLGLSSRSVRRLDSSGRLPRPVRCGGSVRWRLDELRLWVAAGCPDRSTWDETQAESATPH
jgi:predicted DNA-binding transcriptional regulator AlpA